jgi:hypothetical protein
MHWLCIGLHCQCSREIYETLAMHWQSMARRKRNRSSGSKWGDRAKPWAELRFLEGRAIAFPSKDNAFGQLEFGDLRLEWVHSTSIETPLLDRSEFYPQ